MVRKMLRLGLGTRVAGATLAIVPVLAAACGGSTASAGPGATVPHAAPTSTTSADPYAIPSPITAAYVQRVLEELDQIDVAATRIVLAQRSLVPDAARLIRSISTSSSFSDQSMIVLNQIDHGLNNYRPNPGPVRDTVTQVVAADPSCIFVGALRDYSELEKAPPPLHTSYFMLQPRKPEDDPARINPTPWVIAFLGYNTDGSPMENRCPSHP
jgi:hypothetical protein